jgi:hypothetical protein
MKFVDWHEEKVVVPSGMFKHRNDE